ncbi:hypothetical protein [Streptomyces sp. NPDC055134]
MPWTAADPSLTALAWNPEPDALTVHVAREWLDYRRRRWPDTATPHLLINKCTALDTGPVSQASFTAPLRGQVATLEQLRVDRQLEEALVHGPDPLHLAEVFGLDEKTAIRYAYSARPSRNVPLMALVETDHPCSGVISHLLDGSPNCFDRVNEVLCVSPSCDLR